MHALAKPSMGSYPGKEKKLCDTCLKCQELGIHVIVQIIASRYALVTSGLYNCPVVILYGRFQSGQQFALLVGEKTFCNKKC